MTSKCVILNNCTINKQIKKMSPIKLANLTAQLHNSIQYRVAVLPSNDGTQLTLSRAVIKMYEVPLFSFLGSLFPALHAQSLARSQGQSTLCIFLFPTTALLSCMCECVCVQALPGSSLVSLQRCYLNQNTVSKHTLGRREADHMV